MRTYGNEQVGRIKIYTPYGRFPLRDVAAAVRGGDADPSGIVAAIRDRLRSRGPGISMYDVSSLAAELSSRIVPRTLTTWAVSLFAVFAVCLACLGVYSAVSYVIAQRTGEFGIRMVMGAAPLAILLMSMRRGMALTATGIGCGLLLAFFATRLSNGTGAGAPA